MNKISGLLIINLIVWVVNLMETGDKIDIIMTTIAFILLLVNSIINRFTSNR